MAASSCFIVLYPVLFGKRKGLAQRGPCRSCSARSQRDFYSYFSMTASTASAGVKEQSPPDEIVLLPGDSTETKLETLRQIADTADYTDMSYTDFTL